jgi:hypothetical protein
MKRGTDKNISIYIDAFRMTKYLSSEMTGQSSCLDLVTKKGNRVYLRIYFTLEYNNVLEPLLYSDLTFATSSMLSAHFHIDQAIGCSNGVILT